MRRVAGLVLSAFGTFLIVLALLTRFVVVGEAVKFPLNENTITTLVASNASYFSPAKVAEVTGATLEDTLTVQGNNAAGNSGTAVWNEFSYVYDRTNALTVNYTNQTLAFDRRSGALVNCCGTTIGTKTNVHVSGLGYVWPFNAQKKTYQVYDATLLKSFPATYAGTATIEGEKTYKYVETIPPTLNGTIAVPGTLIGQKSAVPVTLPEYYTATTTEYVDPITGGPVKGISYQHIYLQDSSGNQVLTVINATFTSTPASIASTVSTVKSDDGKIDLISFILPVVLGLVGIVLLVMGVILAAARRGEAEYEDGYEEEHEPGEVQV